MADHPDNVVRQKRDEFLRAWESGQRPEIAKIVQSVPLSLVPELLQLIIPIDIEFRATSGERVDFKNYEALGGHAANIAAAYFSIDDTPGPGDKTIRSKAPEEKPSLMPASITANRLDETTKIAGKYKLIRQIGSGGMGAVWLAQQEKPVRRRVAIKVIRTDAGSSEAIARFEAERQALAMMNHPNIAQVLDAGTLDDGSPFFVMELVKGMPISRYCNQNRLSIRDRIGLLVNVCNAIQHAHQKGIIHRDIKPSNILVSILDDQPVPKVIDFGLAKALEHHTQLTDETMLTEKGRVVGTLQYMSPEQAGSDELDIDARTDIYSLGVVLYQLLTGSTPLDRETISNNTLIQIVTIICKSEIQRPSARLQQNPDDLVLTSSQRQIEPNRLIQVLQGELDWIVMQALEKDRTNRYQTAVGLADDLNRYLNNEPVQARPPSTSYLVGKFVRKHKGFVTSVAIVTALLIAGIFTSTYFAIMANFQKNRADDRLEIYKTFVSSANPLSGAAKGMSSYEMLRKAEKAVAEKLNDDPLGQAELFHQIGVTYRGQGKNEWAVSSLNRAFNLRKRELGHDHPNTLETQSQLAVANQFVDIDKMLSLMNDLYQRQSGLLPVDSPEMFEIRHLLATASLVTYKEKKKEGDVVPELISNSLKILEENYTSQKSHLGPDHDDTLKTLTNLANVHLKNDNAKLAIQLGTQAIAAWKRKVDSAKSEEIRNSSQVKYLIAKNNFAEALQKNEEYERAIAIYRETLDQKERQFDLGHVSWRTTLRLLVVCLFQANQPDAAKDQFWESSNKIKNSSDVFDRDDVMDSLKRETLLALEQNSLPTDWLTE